MRSQKDPRHIARILAVMDLYKLYFPQADLETFESEELEIGNYTKSIRENIVKGVQENSAEIDKLIDDHSDPVKSVDLDNLILQIIRLALFEGFVGKTIPPKVAVDEAIELARDFGMELSTKKVSGILGKIFENTVKKED